MPFLRYIWRAWEEGCKEASERHLKNVVSSSWSCLRKESWSFFYRHFYSANVFLYLFFHVAGWFYFPPSCLSIVLFFCLKYTIIKSYLPLFNIKRYWNFYMKFILQADVLCIISLVNLLLNIWRRWWGKKYLNF